MSGTRHHFIPRFLQEGFASHRSGDKVFTWVHRKGVEPFNTNIINAGVEGHFYTNEENTTADDLITSAEGALGALLDGVRSEESKFLQDPRLPILIAHLDVRTRHLRESFRRSSEHLMSRFVEFLSDGDAFTAYITKKLERDPTFLRESLADELASRGIPSNQLNLFLHLAMQLAPALIQAQQTNFPQLAAHLREVMPAVLKNAAKSGHLKALQNMIAPEFRIQRYAQLTFKIAKVCTPQIILGDSIIVHAVTGSRRYRAFIDANTDLSAVFLPIDDQRVLIGSHGGAVIDVPPDLPNAIARCSLEFFISPQNTDQHEALRNQIGADAHILDQSEIEDIVSKALE